MKLLNKLLLGIHGIILISNGALAQKATDQDMVQEAIEATVRANDPQIIEQFLRESARDIEERAENGLLGETAGATMVFRSGKTAEEVEELVNKYNVEVASAEAKVAVGEEGMVMTMGIGAKDLLFFDGTLSERLTRSSRSMQLSLLTSVQNHEALQSETIVLDELQDPKLVAALTPTLHFYKVDVIGSFDAIKGLSEDFEIAATLMDGYGSIARNYQEHRNNISQMKEGSPEAIFFRLEDGLPPGVPLDRVYAPGNIPDVDNIPRLPRIMIEEDR